MTTRVFSITADGASASQELDVPSTVVQISGTTLDELIVVQASDDDTNWSDATPNPSYNAGAMPTGQLSRNFIASLQLPVGYRVRVVSARCKATTAIRVAIT